MLELPPLNPSVYVSRNKKNLTVNFLFCVGICQNLSNIKLLEYICRNSEFIMTELKTTRFCNYILMSWSSDSLSIRFVLIKILPAYVENLWKVVESEIISSIIREQKSASTTINQH